MSRSRRRRRSSRGGRLAALEAVIQADEADEYVREGALLVMAYLTRTGRVSEREMRFYLRHLLAEMQPQAEHFVWVGWVLAVAHLGYEDLAEQARGLIRRGFVSHDDYRLDDFQRDLRRTLDDPTRMAGFTHDRIEPFGDVVETLAGWHAFSGENEDELVLPSLADYEVPQPIINPLRGIGRNDPCPCGSGKKHKKCCLT